MATPDVTAVETRRTQPGSMSTFDVDAFHATPLQRKPFDYLVVPGSSGRMRSPRSIETTRRSRAPATCPPTTPIAGRRSRSCWRR